MCARKEAYEAPQRAKTIVHWHIDASMPSNMSYPVFYSVVRKDKVKKPGVWKGQDWYWYWYWWLIL
jgi:hypothetical protein